MRGFSKYTKFGIISIFVLLKIENKGEIDISGIICNSLYPRQVHIWIRIYLVDNCLQITHIRSYTEMSIIPTLRISKKLDGTN